MKWNGIKFLSGLLQSIIMFGPIILNMVMFFNCFDINEMHDINNYTFIRMTYFCLSTVFVFVVFMNLSNRFERWFKSQLKE